MTPKDKREIEVFKQFVEVSRLIIIDDSIRKMPEPHPDIECQDSFGNKLAFELVELLDENFAVMFDQTVARKDILYSLYDGLSPDLKNALDKLYAHADIYFTFHDGVTKNKVKQQMPEVFRELLNFPVDLTEARTFSNKTVTRLLEKISIFRSSVNGPMFSVNAVARMGDPTPGALRQKFFTKTYKTNYPIELIAYIDGNPMIVESVWRTATEEFFKNNKQFGPFRKIWIIDLNKRSIEFEVSAA
jgi:hypothetical protein